MHKRLSFLLLFILSGLSINGQNDDEASRIYLSAAEKMISIILETENIDQTVFWGESDILDRLPDSIRNIELIKSSRLKSKRKYNGLAWIEIGPAFSADSDRYQVFCTIRKQKKNYFIAWESGISGYQLHFGPDASTGQLRITEIKKSIIIR